MKLSNKILIIIFEEVIADLVNKKLLSLEMDELNIKISDSSLWQKY